ncbi:MAG TPA: SIMPL domain-containing protein [Candidatus Acidoferrales bacterium]|nr:SIMPL domain-containing protein [Candidatus Acidoferrales bacterium]
MKRVMPLAFVLCLLSGRSPAQQLPTIKFVADTLVVQAEGTYETDPDLATLIFDISSQDKELNKAYGAATESMQRIVALADKNGLKKSDVSTGTLTLTPSYDHDRKGKPKSYSVQGEITLRIHDFSKIGPLLDDAVTDNIVDFHSLTYSLQDEEAAKERAVGIAMQHAVARAKAALDESGQKLGPVRYASLDVRQLIGIENLQSFSTAAETVVELHNGLFTRDKAAVAPPAMPPVRPGKISVSASVQCAFQIMK